MFENFSNCLDFSILIILSNSFCLSISNGILANIAPTILKIMVIEIPKEMNVKPLV